MAIIPEIPAIIINLPIILTIIAITRYVIGFKTWKTYPTLALTLALFAINQASPNILASLSVWALLTITIVGTALATRKILQKFTMNYYARIATMYLGATVMSLIALVVLDALNIGFSISNQFLGISIFLIGSTIDELATLLYKKDRQEFIRRTVSTLAISLICGLLTIWPWWNRTIVGHQEILLFILLADVVVAAWSALRLTEYLRFASLSKN